MKTIKAWFIKLISKLRHYRDCWWYMPFMAFLAAIDAYIFVVPIEAIMIPTVLLNRRRWLSVAIWMTAGSALGAATFAALASHFGPEMVTKLMPGALQSHAWIDSKQYLDRHGFWGLVLVSLSPFPQHPAVAVAGLAHVSALVVLFAVLIGRSAKYVPLCWAVVYSPKFLHKIGLLREHDPVTLDDR
jgi:membrane protein YqaA with SNARE-associated domain